MSSNSARPGSLTGRLVLATSLATAGVLLVAGLAADALLRRALWKEFDAGLATQARALAALVEESEDGLEFEAHDPRRDQGFDREADAAAVYQLWRADGGVLARAANLGDSDLPRVGAAMHAPEFRAVVLPGGEAARMVGMSFAPRQEFERPRAGPPPPVTIAVARPIGPVLATIGRIRAVLASVGAAAVLLSTMLLAWIVRRGLSPVRSLSARIAAVGADDLAEGLPAGGMPSELAPVVERLNELLARLEEAFRRERRFTGDAAHELRTPLAGLRSTLELALTRPRAPEEYRAALRHSLEINHQMQRLIENLLCLARADAGQLETRLAVVDLAELARACWRPFEESARARNVRVEWRVPGAAPVRSDRDYLALVLGNLLQNAAAYVNEGGQVRAWSETFDGVVRLRIANTGSRVSAGDLPRVFERFWRGDGQTSPESGHAGLGLPLCRAVLGKLGGTIEAAAHGDEFVASISVPSAETADAMPTNQP